MNSNFKKFYEEYERLFEKKKASSSNSNRVLGKEENTQTNKNIKSSQKENIHNNIVIPFGYEKNNKNKSTSKIAFVQYKKKMNLGGTR